MGGRRDLLSALLLAGVGLALMLARARTDCL